MTPIARHGGGVYLFQAGLRSGWKRKEEGGKKGEGREGQKPRWRLWSYSDLELVTFNFQVCLRGESGCRWPGSSKAVALHHFREALNRPGTIQFVGDNG